MSLLEDYREMLENGSVTNLSKVVKMVRKYADGVSCDVKRRFCKDWNIPIKIMTEPYFSERLAIYNQYSACIERFGEYLDLVERLGGEHKYFELYNKTKDAAIEYLNKNEDMLFFKEKEDMSKFVALQGFPTGSIFKQTFIGKKLLSIDLTKGNFTALKYYNPAIVGDCETYEEFMSMFTSESYIRDSKYIRQVIFGNVNPKRQVTYEKYLMSLVLRDLLDVIPTESVVFFSADELVLDTDSYTETMLQDVKEVVEKHKNARITTHVEYFRLGYIPEADTYYKQFLDEEHEGTIQLKCITSALMTSVIKALYRNPVRSSDNVFELDGKLAKWLKPQKISSKGLPKVKYSWEK